MIMIDKNEFKELLIANKIYEQSVFDYVFKDEKSTLMFHLIFTAGERNGVEKSYGKAQDLLNKQN